jgi:hypothetical protein
MQPALHLSIRFFYRMNRKYVATAPKRCPLKMDGIAGLASCAEIFCPFLFDSALGSGVIVIF